MIETAIEPRHPSRLEKKANTVASSSFLCASAVVLACKENLPCVKQDPKYAKAK
jgi:hypothetical protein